MVNGKTQMTITEFPHSGTMYEDALETLGLMFGQPQAVVSAYLDELSNLFPLEMHDSRTVIIYSSTISALVRVFRTLHYHQDFSVASFLGQAAQTFPPKVKEAWPMHTVKKNWDRSTLLDFNGWPKDKAEAHEGTKMSSGKPKNKNSKPSATFIRTETGAKIFATITSSLTPSVGDMAESSPTSWIACEGKHPLWLCLVFH